MWAFFELLIFTYEDIDCDLDGIFAVPYFALFWHVTHADSSPHVDLNLHFLLLSCWQCNVKVIDMKRRHDDA